MLAGKLATEAADQYHTYDYFLVAGIIAEIACTGCLLIRRAYLLLPVLTVYLAFMSIADIFGGIVYVHGSTRQYWSVFLAITSAEYCFQLAFMCELAYLLLKPLRETFSHRSLLAGALLFASVFMTAAVASASLAIYRLTESDVGSFFRFNLGFGLFRALVLATILYMAALLGLRSNARVAHLALYFSLYGAVSLFVQIAREYHGPHWNQASIFRAMECLRISSWCIAISLVAWYVLKDGQFGSRVSMKAFGQARQLGR